jgi:glucose-1-phosphate thymidylyltransferase
MNNLVGIIPAAGKGTRLAPFPCPKELFPVGFQNFDVNGEMQKRPKVISQYILENMLEAGVKRILFILGEGKSDIMEFYGDGHRFGCEIGYLYQERLNGMPTAINLARPWIGDATVVFGMPDTIIQPTHALKELLEFHQEHDAMLSLGLFPTDQPQKFGMVEFDDDRNVLSTIDKPKDSKLTHMWGCCVWSKQFTDLIDTHLTENEKETKEIVLGDVFDLALEKKQTVKALPIDGSYIDIGTANELNAALAQFSLENFE